MRIETTSSTPETLLTTIGITSPFSTNVHESNIPVNGFRQPAEDASSGFEPIIPSQPCFPDWNIEYVSSKEPGAVQAISTKLRTHKEEREQPYLLASSLVEGSQAAIFQMGHTLAEWNGRVKPFGTFEKLRQFSDMRELYRDIPAYVVAEDDPNLKMPNPFMGEIMSVYGKLHQKGKEDVMVKSLLEKEAQKYERYHVVNRQSQVEGNPEGFERLKSKFKRRMSGIISSLR